MSSSSQPDQKRFRPVHEWTVAVTLVVTSLTAVAALFFTHQSIEATNGQLGISEQGQITDRYNAAIANLGSRSIDIRLGGIYALQRLMQDSSRDQPTVIAVLCAFVRDRTLSTRSAYKRPPEPPTDTQAALTVVGTRNAAKDGPATVVDFGYSQLSRAQLKHGNLDHANLTGVDLTGADLTGADLTGADLTGAILNRAQLTGANLTGATLNRAQLINATLNRAQLTGATLFSPDLAYANLAGASLTYANLTGAILTGADLTRANFAHANLTYARWPADVVVPKGWLRDPRSGFLHRPGEPRPPWVTRGDSKRSA
jgi:Pentapeptide repeats (8 copies)